MSGMKQGFQQQIWADRSTIEIVVADGALGRRAELVLCEELA